MLKSCQNISSNEWYFSQKSQNFIENGIRELNLWNRNPILRKKKYFKELARDSLFT